MLNILYFIYNNNTIVQQNTSTLFKRFHLIRFVEIYISHYNRNSISLQFISILFLNELSLK